MAEGARIGSRMEQAGIIDVYMSLWLSVDTFGGEVCDGVVLALGLMLLLPAAPVADQWPRLERRSNVL